MVATLISALLFRLRLRLLISSSVKMGMFSESFREPDSHIGYLMFEWVTAGQLLSLPMALAGIGMLMASYKLNNNK